MKKPIFAMMGVFILVGVIAIADGLAQETPPNIKVALTLDNSIYSPDDPILMILTLANEGDSDIITSKGFSDTEFYLLLRFFDDQGNVITSDRANETHAITPATPKVFPDDAGLLLQGELVEILESGWVVSFGPFNAYDFYPLADKSGPFTVKAVIPMTTYPDYLVSSSGIPYVLLDSADWHGPLDSNIVSFTRIADADGDGYFYPVSPPGVPGNPDCDDTNPNVNPGAVEIPGNGIDDDCNPGTSDVAVVNPGTIIIKAAKRTANTEKHPKWIEVPIPDMPIRAYDKSSGSCASDIGINKKKYASIWLSCGLPNKAGATDDLGTVSLEVPPGDYVVIGKYDPDAAPDSGDEVYIGFKVDGLDSGETIEKYLLIR